MGQMFIDNRVVDFEYKSQISQISLTIMSLKKKLWSSDRREHNRFSDHFKRMKKHRDVHNYWIMQSPEVNIGRAKYELNRMKGILNDMIVLSQSNFVIELLNSELDKIEGIEMAIDLDNHKTSFFV